MIARIEDFNTGWCGITFALDLEEIDRLILSLQMLKNKEIGHFHFLEDSSEKSGIADVEISIKGEDEPDNMRILLEKREK